VPNKKSAKKRVLQNRRNELRNKAAKSAMKTAIKSTLEAARTGAADTAEKGKLTQSLIARLWKRGVIHKKKAARLQSRLARNVARVKPQAS
jgi:small subunit ribosomal protein S20